MALMCYFIQMWEEECMDCETERHMNGKGREAKAWILS